MNNNPKTAFFDSIADKWDGWEDLNLLARRLATGLGELGVGADETVLDVGCGTGNLTQALLTRLSSYGRVVAVDISPRMIEVARGKITDERVSWHVVDVCNLPLHEDSCDRVICYSVWPHFNEKMKVAFELFRVLRNGGFLHVWHLNSRNRINEIHAAADDAIRHDTLPSSEETSRLLASSGFWITKFTESAESYLVTAQKRSIW